MIHINDRKGKQKNINYKVCTFFKKNEGCDKTDWKRYATRSQTIDADE